MLQTLPQSDLLCPQCRCSDDVIKYVNNHIDNYDCETLSVDIANMNILDSCKVTTLCSTHHYIKYPNGKIVWKVSSMSVRDFKTDLMLGNSVYIV